jgi:RimJ/RimL family protein N-acetyltransferase
LDNDEAEINVMIGNKNVRRKGFAEEAIKVMMSFGFNTYKKTKYIAKIKDTNLASIKLFEKIGYKEIKKLP